MVSIGAGRSGKYFFTSGAPTTLPIPRPNNATADRTRNSGTLLITVRPGSPAAARTIATVAVSSRLLRRMNTGAANPAAPENSMGSISRSVAADAPITDANALCPA